MAMIMRSIFAPAGVLRDNPRGTRDDDTPLVYPGGHQMDDVACLINAYQTIVSPPQTALKTHANMAPIAFGVHPIICGYGPVKEEI
jgi:hypothetical protein